MSSLVELREVSKGFGAGSTRVEVLRDLDLDVQEGQMLAVVGPSGVGKAGTRSPEGIGPAYHPFSKYFQLWRVYWA